ncbi:hypothetical protein K469DRAFT_710379 [Zopfia rhizophila CBS 207.26]|uniref:Uncharacterized protein n=1 Tax=Zopfia rhizophila CBS 207.26 TaxID=1314779 RepID=A0A6A6E275_9PEZI|nr:hypothetical protein K469DRAFT_710379 [Zopfia rhizophila CBS 207.26]
MAEFGDGSTALYIAIRNRKKEAVRLLLKYGGPVDGIDENRPENPENIIVTATKYPRPKVALWWYEERAKSSLGNTDATFLELTLDKEDESWLINIQRRKSSTK